MNSLVKYGMISIGATVVVITALVLTVDNNSEKASVTIKDADLTGSAIHEFETKSLASVHQKIGELQGELAGLSEKYASREERIIKETDITRITSETNDSESLSPLGNVNELSSGDNLSQDQIRTAELMQWEDAKTQLETEEVDENWASMANINFETDLQQLSEKSQFTLISTDCRSTRCKAEVEFPSYSAALKNYSNLLHYAYRSNCARETMLPPPDDNSGDFAYRATVIFNCSNDEYHKG